MALGKRSHHPIQNLHLGVKKKQQKKTREKGAVYSKSNFQSKSLENCINSKQTSCHFSDKTKS